MTRRRLAALVVAVLGIGLLVAPSGFEVRLTAAEAAISNLQSRVSALEGRVSALESGTTAPTTTTTAPTTTTVAPTTTTLASTTTTTAVPTTTTLLVTTTTTPPGACSGVQVAVGASIQTAVNANPGTTTFCLAAGRHLAQQVIPKTGNVFRGVIGTLGQKLTILDGNLTATRSIHTHSDTPRSFTVRDLIVERYATPAEQVTLGGSGADDSLFDNVEVRNNGGGGIGFGSRTVVRNCFVHHNAQIGFLTATPITGSTVENCEISFNNPNDQYAFGWEAGGSKFLYADSLTLRGNYVHDNHGAGLWSDDSGINTVYENNRVENNYGPGIFHEISGSAVIRNNTVRGNAHQYYIGGILVANSPNVEVHNNVLSGNDGGIIALDEDRPEGRVENLWVHDNTVAYITWITGLLANGTSDLIFTSNNRFDRNTYDTPNVTGTWFAFNRDVRTWIEWRNFGMDLNGSIG